MRGEDARWSRTTGGMLWITPACAGKTCHVRACGYLAPDHPRMRGEDVCVDTCLLQFLGSPPHARGRLFELCAHCPINRITPACAGKTDWRSAKRASAQDHPRMRGEDGIGYVRGQCITGSPPHARGRRLFD